MTVTVDASGLEEKVRGFYGDIADRAVDDMFAEMRAEAPRDTGQMTENLESVPDDDGDQIVRRLHAPEQYSSFQEEGTGVYGPEGTPIVPTTAKVLVFFWKKTGKVEFRTSVLGSPATHWWSKVIDRWAEFLRGALG